MKWALCKDVPKKENNTKCRGYVQNVPDVQNVPNVQNVQNVHCKATWGDLPAKLHSAA